jgi:hypothetical protein
MGQLDHHDLAVHGFAELLARHQHTVRDPRVVGSHVRDARFQVQAADDFFGAALEHFDDGALGAALEARRFDARRDPVPVHDFAHLLRWQVDGRGAVVGEELAVAVAGALHGAHDEAGELFAQAVLAAAVEHDLAALQQLREFLLGLGRSRGAELRRDLVEA